MALPSTTPLQIDAGASASGTLDARTVTDSAPAAMLRPGSIPADLLASTPDANTTDPFIQQKAAELDYDPQRIFAYLQQRGRLRVVRRARSVAHEGRSGATAGNALDVASLGVALMRASGIPARYVGGTLTGDRARDLILSMFPAPYQTAGYIAPGTPTADPANDPRLLAEATEHYWFQFDTGAGMVDADPLIAGSLVGQTLLASLGHLRGSSRQPPREDCASRWTPSSTTSSVPCSAAPDCRRRRSSIRRSTTWIWSAGRSRSATS